MKNSFIFRLLVLSIAFMGIFVLSGCSPDAAEQAAETQSETKSAPPLLETEPAADFPKVVVLYGRDDLVPWLESQN